MDMSDVNDNLVDDEMTVDGQQSETETVDTALEDEPQEDKWQDGELPQEKQGKQEKTPISDEERKKYGIPEKFKYFEDVVRWGAEAEKAKSRAEQEKARYEKELREKEKLFENLQQSLDKQEEKGTITPEEKERLIAQLHEDWATDPIMVLEKYANAIIKRIEEKRQEENMRKRLQEEEMEFRKQYDNWDTVVKPALAKIALERPYLQSIEEALAIYEMRKKRDELLNKADSERKKTEKRSAFSETGFGTGAFSKDIFEKIASAKTVEELDELSKSLPRIKRE